MFHEIVAVSFVLQLIVDSSKVSLASIKEINLNWFYNAIVSDVITPISFQSIAIGSNYLLDSDNFMSNICM